MAGRGRDGLCAAAGRTDPAATHWLPDRRRESAPRPRFQLPQLSSSSSRGVSPRALRVRAPSKRNANVPRRWPRSTGPRLPFSPMPATSCVPR
jgi:hypothetical protein